MKNLPRWALGLLLFILSAMHLFAGASGLNVVVVVNQSSTNSLELGNYYCERRGVPPQNVLRINWTGNKIEWNLPDMDSYLRAPLLAMLTSRQLSNQIDHIVLSMDIPYRVTDFGSATLHDSDSTTSALFYGFKSSPLDPWYNCTLAGGSTSAYAGSENIFRQKPPIDAVSNSWLAVTLTSSNLTQAKAVVDRGVASDYTFPPQTVFLDKTTDIARNVRYQLFDNTVFNCRLRGNYSVQRTNTATPASLGVLLGYGTGIETFTLTPSNFVPGAMADSLTSFAGFLLEDLYQTDAHDLLNAGATASYGTVVEPCNYLQKFPSSLNYFYQARGFDIAESYYMSVTNPYMGVIVGEPLSVPFALPSSGSWVGVPANALLSGATNLSLQFNAPDRTRPVQTVNLFVDGTLAQTITNLPPRFGNIIYVTLPGATNLPYTVLPSATVASVANNLANVINGASALTKVSATVSGDRLELQSTDLSRSGAATYLSTSNFIGTANALTTAVHPARSNFLDTVAWGVRGFYIGTSVVSNDYLTLTVTKTNGAIVSVSVTNYAPTYPLDAFVQNFISAINSTPALQGADGLIGEDLQWYGPSYMTFNLRARGQGWAAAQIQTEITGPFDIHDPGVNRLDENISDLRPRNHLYVTAGLTNLPITFSFNTSAQPDGYHELTAVAYEGSHVRTQTRVSQTMRIQNTTLSATLTNLVGDTNTAVEATLQFSVVANTNSNITRIELFSTGGSWGVVSNQPSANFSLAATNLGIGRHPFYAVVTRTDNAQYRTATKWIRIIGAEPAFKLTVINTLPTLSWPATAGRRYEILSTTNLANPFTLRDVVTPTNSLGLWSETNKSSAQRFYRVRTGS